MVAIRILKYPDTVLFWLVGPVKAGRAACSAGPSSIMAFEVCTEPRARGQEMLGFCLFVGAGGSFQTLSDSERRWENERTVHWLL